MRRQGAKHGFGVEQGMTLVGIALAAVTAVFAYLAIERNDGVPRIGGAEHLAIFAMPTNAQDERLPTGAVVVSEAAPQSQIELSMPIDYLPTATIRGKTVGEFQVRKVLGDRVVVQGPSGATELRPGDFAKGVGRLREIRLVRGRWTAVIVPESAIGHSSR